MEAKIATDSTARRNQVTEFLVSNYLFGDESKLPGDAESLLKSGVIDSTGILELIQFLEDNFDIEIKDNETVPENLDSVDAILEFVGRKAAGI